MAKTGRPSINNLDDFVLDFWNEPAPASPDADLFAALSLSGDDADQFLQEFAEEFDIDISGLLWYFHYGEEWHLGRPFYKPLNHHVTHIPITRTILENAISTKKWPVQYPEHSLPKIRWDLIINKGLALLLPAALLLMFAIKFLNRV